jgi:hypothetical protein
VTDVGAHDRMVAPSGVHARRFDDEIVILDLEGGDYYSLDAVGAEVWEALARGETPAQAARVLVDRYRVEYERAVNDCVILANELCMRGLLRRGAA